jgi:pimeloyl-ACP methyl ester carboxylesterase
VFSTDLRKKVTGLEVPVYFFSGRYDYTVNHDLSKDYLNQLRAPEKGFYTFENSAHSPFFEEPEKVREVLQEDVLTGKVRLADAR